MVANLPKLGSRGGVGPIASPRARGACDTTAEPDSLASAGSEDPATIAIEFERKRERHKLEHAQRVIRGEAVRRGLHKTPGVLLREAHKRARSSSSSSSSGSGIRIGATISTTKVDNPADPAWSPERWQWAAMQLLLYGSPNAYTRCCAACRRPSTVWRSYVL